MKIVYRAANPQEAHIVAGMLQSEGIEAHASGTFLQGGIGELPASDFAVVRVREEDEARAKAVVISYDANAASVEWDTSESVSGDPLPETIEHGGWQRVLLLLAAVCFAVLVFLSLF